jgi:hypothetical protein
MFPLFVINTFICINIQYYVGFEVLTGVTKKSSLFCDIQPSSLLKVNGSFGGTYRLHFQIRNIGQARNQLEASKRFCFFMISLLDYSSPPKIEVTCSSETSVEFQQSLRRYIQETGTLQYE